MPSRSDLEIKSRLVLGLGLVSLVVFLLLRLLLPLLAIIGLGAAGFWLWRQYCKKQQQQKKQQARINAKFYQLLQQQQGRISVLDFAMRTQLDGAAAQDYLNTQAQSFSAFFETTPQGDLIYVFSSAAVRGQASQAEAAWAYAEQAYSEQIYSEQIRAQRVHAQKTQTAWNNAKQIRTLRQLAKTEPPDKRQPMNRPALTIGPGLDSPVSQTEKAADPKTEGIAERQSRHQFKHQSEHQSGHQSGHQSENESKPQTESKRVIQLPTSRASEASRQSEVMRGRAHSESDSPSQRLAQRIITIDVKAVRS